MNEKDREEVINDLDSEEVDKKHKYFVITPDDDMTYGPFNKQNAMNKAKQKSKFFNKVYVAEAKVKFEVEPKMTVIK